MYKILDETEGKVAADDIASKYTDLPVFLLNSEHNIFEY